MTKNNYSIKKSFFSETAHIVRNAVSERCKYNVHGHSYQWNVTLYSDKLQENGMVMDFKELGFIKELVDMFDHSMVLWQEEKEDILKFFSTNFKRVIVMKENTTAENMAKFLTNIIINIVKNSRYYSKVIKGIEVEVYETKYSSAIYTIDNINTPVLKYDDVVFHATEEIMEQYNKVTEDNNCVLLEFK